MAKPKPVKKSAKSNKRGPRAQLFSQRTLKRITAAGLPTPDPNLSQSQFARLQKQWYAKLAKEGFDDIEWVDHTTGRGHDSAFMKGGGAKTYHAGRELYFQLATNYLMHCKNLLKKPYHRFIWRLHSEGLTYEEIESQVAQRYKNPVSKFTIYYQLKELAQLCYVWNATDPDGLLVKRAEDKANIEQKNLEDFYAVEYNWIISGQVPERASSGKRFAKNRSK